jgi:glycosyltransferase involved in cell wall biosynthesis
MSLPVTGHSGQPDSAAETHDGRSVRVAIVITCYNLGAYLREAYDSARGQTLRGVEIVVVDDGSTDAETQRVLAELASEGARVLHLQNMGVPRASNVGIRATSAPYIVCLDADDRLRPEYLARAAPVLDEDPEVGVVTPYYATFGLTHEVRASDVIQFPELLVHNLVAVSAMFRRTAWEAAGGFCEAIDSFQDWELWISIVERGLRVHVIPEILFEHREREGSLLSWSRKPENYVPIMSQIYERHRATYARYGDEVRAARDKEFVEVLNWALSLRQTVTSQQQRADEMQTWIGELQRIAEEREGLIRELQRIAEERQAIIRHQEAVIHRVDEHLDRLRLRPLIRFARRVGLIH